MNAKLLIDENLSWRLVSLLKGDFHEIEHVANTKLGESSSDTSIWEYARKHKYSIVTNDGISICLQ